MFTEHEQSIISQALSILESKLNTHSFIANSSRSVVEFCQLEIGHLDREVFAVLFLDTQHRLISFDKMFFGTLDSASVHPREIARRALTHNASAVILTHNHPSNETLPSEADKRLTTVLVDALDLISVRVLDHIIVGINAHYCFTEEGLL